MRGSAALAAGAAIGMPKLALARTLREGGPVEFKVDLCLTKPLAIKGSLFSDESKGIFGIRSMCVLGKKVAAETHMNLARLQEVMQSSVPKTISALVHKDGKVYNLSLIAAVEGKDRKRVSLREVGAEGVPFWIQAKDIKAVL